MDGAVDRYAQKKTRLVALVEAHRDADLRLNIYDGDAYRQLKARYDPDGKLKDLYAKCVLRE